VQAAGALDLTALRPLSAPPEIAASDAPQVDTEEVGSCPVCGSVRFSEHAAGFDYELITCRNRWPVVRCADCGHAWLNPRPAVSALDVIYPPTYYAYDYEERINSFAVHGKRLLDSWKFRGILRSLIREPRGYVDIGCGTGRFLKLMDGRGVPRSACYGIELNEDVVGDLRESGYPVFCERVEECDEIPAASVDLATMFHVIEHVDDPAAVVARSAEWLAPGGVLAVETPNLDSLDHRLFADTWWGGYHFPRHWNLFTPETLERLLVDAGLEPLRTTYQTGHAFWMYSFHHRLRYGSRPHRRLASAFDPLTGLPLLLAFTAFDKVRAALRLRTSAMLMLARKPG
jgi:SAM-dependent methyltransferase